MAENNKSMANAKTDEEKDKIKAIKQKATTGLRTCNNILTMTKPLHAKAPSFIGDKRINLSWKEATKSASTNAPAVGAKRPATAGNGSNHIALKKGRGSGGVQNQLVNRAIGGLPGGGRGGLPGGGRGRVSGGGRGGTRGRGWGGRGRGSGRGRGRGYW